jgi:regulator of replication initiation timing
MHWAQQMRADVVDELATALRTQGLMHKKIGKLRNQVHALTDKNKLLRKKLRKLEQRLSALAGPF